MPLLETFLEQIDLAHQPARGRIRNEMRARLRENRRALRAQCSQAHLAFDLLCPAYAKRFFALGQAAFDAATVQLNDACGRLRADIRFILLSARRVLPERFHLANGGLGRGYARAVELGFVCRLRCQLHAAQQARQSNARGQQGYENHACGEKDDQLPLGGSTEPRGEIRRPHSESGLNRRDRYDLRATARAWDAAHEPSRLDDQHIARQTIEHPFGGVADDEAVEARP